MEKDKAVGEQPETAPVKEVELYVYWIKYSWVKEAVLEATTCDYGPTYGNSDSSCSVFMGKFTATFAEPVRQATPAEFTLGAIAALEVERKDTLGKLKTINDKIQSLRCLEYKGE